MLSDEIRRRLAHIHSPHAGPAVSHAVHMVRSAGLPISSPRASDTWLQDGQQCENASGSYWRIRRPLTTILPSLEIPASPQPTASHCQSQHPELAAVAEHFPQGTLFLDLETCGFSGSPLFLAGTVWREGDNLVLDQLFARHYGEERAVLDALWQIAARNQVLVTFNGKSFDWPMVHDRSTRHHLGRDGRERHSVPRRVASSSAGLSRQDLRPELTHCDLLHHARRRWKQVLPNCRLQTLERYICNRARSNDLSGALVPIAYQQFVRSGAAGPVASILHHNALDLATLVQLTLKLATPLAA